MVFTITTLSFLIYNFDIKYELECCWENYLA